MSKLMRLMNCGESGRPAAYRSTACVISPASGLKCSSPGFHAPPTWTVGRKVWSSIRSK